MFLIWKFMCEIVQNLTVKKQPLMMVTKQNMRFYNKNSTDIILGVVDAKNLWPMGSLDVVSLAQSFSA